MRHQKLIGVGGALGSVVLAGCGISTHVTAAPANTSTSQMSGTVHTSGAPSPSPAAPVSSSPSSESASPTSTASGGSGKSRASKLPQSFPRYSLVVSTVGRLLAQSSSVPVYLPTSYPYAHYIDVQYALKNGYRLTLNAGLALPANSPQIQGGYAEFLFSIRALPWSATYHANYVPLNPTPPAGPHGPIILAPGIVGTSYPSPPPSSENQLVLITWQEDGWIFTVYGAGSAGVGTAKQIAKLLQGAMLPGSHGKAIFTVGTHVPSIASYELNGVRYVIEGTGAGTVSLVEKMVKVHV